MTQKLRMASVLLLAASFAVPVFAQGDAAGVYKAKCAMCHGPAGTPNPAMGTAMGIKPASAYKAASEADMIATVKNGKGKMKAIAGLSDAQVKEAVATFKSFAK